MILQNIEMPVDDICDKYELYFHAEENVYYEEGRLLFDKTGVCSFDTYFNGVSIDKWNKYTNVGKITARINIKGKFKVTASYVFRVSPVDIRRFTTYRTVVECDTLQEIEIPMPENGTGMLYFTLEALEDGGQFTGGYYHVDNAESSIRNVKIGLGICTFKREKFIEKNIRLLNENVFDNKNCILNGHLEVYISDNGKTLDKDKLSNRHIHIFDNKNTGGAGGFTRTMMEMTKDGNPDGITHVLVMDDDILLDTEALVKTYRILTIIKDEYVDAFIGGAMLRNDLMDIQVEAGASWNAGRLMSYKGGLPLGETEPCLYNETEERYEFNAWWYCCFPIGVVRDDNLPLPIFIRGDDLEYGLRNMKTLILMNGICVWHEPFENKYSSFLEYYIIRNKLIDNSFHCPQYGKLDLIKDILFSTARESMLYRYKNVRLFLRGVNDYLEGPDFLFRTDGEQLHKDIMAAGYRAVPVEELGTKFYLRDYEEYKGKDDGKLGKVVRFLTLNGHLIPSFTKQRTVSMSGVITANVFGAAQVLYYDIIAKKGFLAVKDTKEFFDCWKEAFKTILAVMTKYDYAKHQYRTKGKKLRTRKFWNKYLGL